MTDADYCAAYSCAIFLLNANFMEQNNLNNCKNVYVYNK